MTMTKREFNTQYYKTNIISPLYFSIFPLEKRQRDDDDDADADKKPKRKGPAPAPPKRK